MDEGDHVKFAAGEFCLKRGGVDRDAPLELERFGLFAAATGHVDPFVRKGARAAAMTPQADEVERKTGCLVPINSWRRGWIES